MWVEIKPNAGKVFRKRIYEQDKTTTYLTEQKVRKCFNPKQYIKHNGDGIQGHIALDLPLFPPIH